MKLLYVLNNFSVGGAETGLLHLLRHGFFEGFELEIVALFKGSGRLEPMLRQAGFAGEARALMPQERMTVPLLLKAYGKLKAAMRQAAPEIILLSLPQANILGRIAARACPKAKVATFEHTAHFLKPYYPTLLRFTSPRVDAVLYDCEVTAEAMKPFYRGTKKRAWQYVPLTCVDSVNAKRDYAVRGNAPLVLSVGRLSAPKNYPAALEAIALLRKRGFSVRYAIAGEGEMKGALEEKVREIGITDAVDFLGFTDPELWHAKADIFLQASLWEGLCISAIDAMGAGLPVAATDVGGMRDYGRDGENMVKARDVSAEAIADALEQLLRDEALRRKLGTQAREDMRERFGVARVKVELRNAAEKLRAL